MKIDTMRGLERWVGIPLCVFVGLLIKLYSSLRFWHERRKPDLSDARQIVCIKFFGMGSLLLSQPLLRALKHKFPKAKIHLITFSENTVFVHLLNVVDEVHGVRRYNFFVFAIDIFRLWIYFLKLNVDVSLDLEFFSKFSILFSFFSRMRYRVGFYARSSYRGDFLHNKVTFNSYRHIADNFFELGKSVDISEDKSRYPIALPSLINIYSQTLLHEISGSEKIEKNFIIINVNSSNLCEYRNWSIENYINLMKDIRLKHYNTKLVLIGGKTDVAYVEGVYRFFREDPFVINMTGKTTIKQLLALLETAALVVSNDSGPAHLSSAYNTPTIVLFGPEIPVIYRPIGQRTSVVYKGIHCSPCMNVYNNKDFESCKDNICMKEIKVPEVMQLVDRVITKERRTYFNASLELV